MSPPKPPGGRGPRPPMGISAPVNRILSGPSAMAAQRKLASLDQRRQEWPYTHVFPPPQAVRVNIEGSIPAPSVGVQTQVLQYQVPDGFQFAFTELMQFFNGTGFVLGNQTQITWVLDVNTPIPAPAGGIAQGYPVQGLSPSFLPKGGVVDGTAITAFGMFAPWPLLMPEILQPLDILRSKVTTSVAITPGSPNFFISVFLGWIWETTQ